MAAEGFGGGEIPFWRMDDDLFGVTPPTHPGIPAAAKAHPAIGLWPLSEAARGGLFTPRRVGMPIRAWLETPHKLGCEHALRHFKLR